MITTDESGKGVYQKERGRSGSFSDDQNQPANNVDDNYYNDPKKGSPSDLCMRGSRGIEQDLDYSPEDLIKDSESE